MLMTKTNKQSLTHLLFWHRKGFYVGLICMELKEFGKYLKGKSINKLLHRARRQSLKRILASEEEIKTVHKKTAQKKVGVKR